MGQGRSIAKIESILDMTPAWWDMMFAVNTRGVFLTWRAAGEAYIAQVVTGIL